MPPKQVGHLHEQSVSSQEDETSPLHAAGQSPAGATPVRQHQGHAPSREGAERNGTGRRDSRGYYAK